MSIFERFFGDPKPEDIPEVDLVDKTEQEELLPFDESDSGDGVPEEPQTSFHDFEAAIRENPELGKKAEGSETGKVE